MKREMNPILRTAAVSFLAISLLLSLPACSSQPAASVTPSETQGVTEDACPSNLANIPNIVKAGSDLYYINQSTNPDERYTLYTMKADGSERRPLLTPEQWLDAFRKIRQDTKEFYPRNIIEIKDDRIIFICDAQEEDPETEKKVGEVYICSVDLTGGDLQVVESIGLPVRQIQPNRWYNANCFDMNITYIPQKYAVPIVVDGWRYSLDEKGHLFREKQDGTGRQVLYDLDQVPAFTLQDGWIYFSLFSSAGIRRMSVDGEDITVLNDPCGNRHGYGRFLIYGNWIYYLAEDHEKRITLRRLSTDGSADELIPTQNQLYSFQITEGRILYTYRVPTTKTFTLTNDLRTMNLDGTDDRQIDIPLEEPPSSAQANAPKPSLSPEDAARDGGPSNLIMPPHIVREGSDLYYIKETGSNTKEMFTLYTMKADGSGRRPLLTADQGLEAFRKINQDVFMFHLKNIQCIKDGRIIFVCQTVEDPGENSPDVSKVSVCSVDLTGSDLKVVDTLYQGKSGKALSEWYRANCDYYSMLFKDYAAPIMEDGWRYYLDEKRHLIREKPDGTDRQVIYNKIVTEFTIQDGWIYFNFPSWNKIFRMTVDGEGLTVLKGPGEDDNTYMNLRVCGNWLYYLDNNAYTLHRIKIDGSEDELIPTDHLIKSFQIIENRLFYVYWVKGSDSTYSSPGDLRAMNLDGSNDQAID